jgi:beta-ribofuranosylaminobenzene 5'-phosphate synthase
MTAVMPTQVSVKSTARLHMGFFDLNGSTGRMFGSLGVAIDVPYIQIEVAKSEKTLIDAKNNENVIKIVENLVKSLKLDKCFSLKIVKSIPDHVGLGSGTQLALAIGAGLNRLFDLDLTVPQIAEVALRGKRSGIGIGTFEHGGLIVDGGRGSKETPPPVIARHNFPENWPILLIFDKTEQGVHGEQELMAFDSLQKASLDAAQTLAHSVLLQALPALVERDYATFSRVIYMLQHATGEYFSPIQGGLFKSKHVAEILNFLYENNVLSAGQSSWGPTGFAIFENDESARAMLKLLRQKFSNFNNISFQIVHGKNTGASILES